MHAGQENASQLNLEKAAKNKKLKLASSLTQVKDQSNSTLG